MFELFGELFKMTHMPTYMTKIAKRFTRLVRYNLVYVGIVKVNYEPPFGRIVHFGLKA